MLGLNKPLFFYPWMSNFLSLCLEMKAKGFFLVHIHMDYLENNSEAHVDISDITLVIQRCTFHKLRARFGDKVHLIPQSVNFKLFHSQMSNFKEQQGDSLSIPRPRLGYTGPIHNRLNLSMLSELLLRHPNWHFVSFGSREKIFRFPNFHVIPWKRQEELPKIVAAFDVGFMPYDCYDEQQLHCLPLKLFEFFAVGIPVVSTPLVHLWEYEKEGLVYFGDTVEELERAIIAALQEPRDSPKRQRRIEIARAHSIENLAKVLDQVLPLRDR